MYIAVNINNLSIKMVAAEKTRIRELTDAMQEADGRVAYVYVRPA